MLGKSTNLTTSNGISFFVPEIAGFIRAERELFRFISPVTRLIVHYVAFLTLTNGEGPPSHCLINAL